MTDYRKMFQQFKKLDINRDEINFSHSDYSSPYFCTPVGAEILGWESDIHYCFIDGMGDMIFAVNPQTCQQYYVYPVAENFRIFLTLIVSANSRNPVEQIITFSDVSKFTDFLKSEKEWFDRSEHSAVIDKIQREFDLQPISPTQVYDYVRKLQQSFDYSRIKFTDEFYEITGLAKPDGSYVPNENPVQFDTVQIKIVKKH